MRRSLIFGIALAFMVTSVSAVVGGPEPEDGEMAITGSGSSASATTAVGPNGTEWKSSVKMRGRSPRTVNETLENVSFRNDSHEVEFSGNIEAPTPCHVIESEVNETGEGYVLNIKTVNEADLGNGSACIQQIGMINYDASFSTGEDFSLEVRHNNETVRELEHPGMENRDKGKGIMERLKSLISWNRWIS
ncbi:MAG: hypothetical protein ABEJ56_02360 [Candidatus Nanohaloarchaea archaeon]